MTQTPVRLIPMDCVKCRAPLPARPDEAAWVCEQCGQGQMLNDSGALAALEVFFSQAVPQGQKGRPFWVTRGQARISARVTYKGDEGRDAAAFWGQPRLFYIPAWEASLEETVQMGVYLLRSPERMIAGSPTGFLPVVTGPGDLRALAEFMVVSIEADRRDALKTIDFTLELDPPQLWVLP